MKRKSPCVIPHGVTGHYYEQILKEQDVKTLKTLMAAVLMCGSISICGCGGAEPGSTVTDETPGGTSMSTISEDPNEVANQMGADYDGIPEKK